MKNIGEFFLVNNTKQKTNQTMTKTESVFYPFIVSKSILFDQHRQGRDKAAPNSPVGGAPLFTLLLLL